MNNSKKKCLVAFTRDTGFCSIPGALIKKKNYEVVNFGNLNFTEVTIMNYELNLELVNVESDFSQH